MPLAEPAHPPEGAHIGLGHFLPGGVLLPAGVRGINETYRGWIEIDQARIQAYVKLLHPWEVFNEALGSILCQLAGLQTPRSYIVLVERSDYPSSPIFAEPGVDRALAFASHAMPLKTLTRQVALHTPAALRELVAGWTEWPDVLVFDQWIANPDRHSGNLLVGGPGEVFLIDHGLSFYRRNWTPEQLLEALSLVTTRLWNDVIQGVVTLPERISAAERAYSAGVRYSTIDSGAAMLFTRVSPLIPAPNIQALAEFLNKRCQAAPGVVANALGVPGLALGDQP